jgi:hypothetical protein
MLSETVHSEAVMIKNKTYYVEKMQPAIHTCCNNVQPTVEAKHVALRSVVLTKRIPPLPTLHNLTLFCQKI